VGGGIAVVELLLRLNIFRSEGVRGWESFKEKTEASLAMIGGPPVVELTEGRRDNGRVPLVEG
jgi:hypothetical protein